MLAVPGTVCTRPVVRCLLREEWDAWEEASLDKRRSSVPCQQALWGQRAEAEAMHALKTSLKYRIWGPKLTSDIHKNSKEGDRGREGAEACGTWPGRS